MLIFLAVAILGVMYILYTWLSIENGQIGSGLLYVKSIESTLAKGDLIVLEVIKSASLVAIILVVFFFLLRTNRKNQSLRIAIAEREQAEEKISILSHAVRSISEFVSITDMSDKILFVNSAFLKAYKYEEHELVGKSIGIIRSTNNSPDVVAEILPATLRGGWHGEILNKRKDGSEFTAFISTSVIQDENGKPVALIGVSTDVTDRKRVEEQRNRQAGLITSLLDSIPDIVFFKDTKGVYLGCNPSFAEFIGKPRNEILGKTDYDLVDKATADFFRHHDLEVLKQKLPRHIEEWITYPDGRKILIDTLKTPYWGDDGSLIGIIGISRDITEKKETEEKIKESEAKFNKIFNNSPSLMVLLTVNDRRIAEVNETFLQKTGLSRDEIIGKVVTDVQLLSFGDTQQEVSTELQKDQRITGMELELKTQSGDTIYGVFSREIIESYGRKYFLTVITDISDIKHAKGELEESREKYRGLSEASFEAIFISEKGLCIEQNQAAEKMFGYTSEEAMVRYGTEWIAPEDREMVMKNMLAGFEEPYEARALKKDGTTFPCILRGKMMHYKGKNVRVTSLSDITARKQAEEEVKKVSTRLALATRAGGVGVWDYNITTNHLLWDDQMFALYGIGKADSPDVLETWQGSIHPDDKEQTNRELLLAVHGEKELDGEFRVVWPDGSVHNIRALATVQRDISGNALRLVGTNWDITEQKKNEAVLLKAMQQAETANKAKSVFLASMTHEIRTPLNAIIGFSQLMTRDRMLTESQKEYNVSIIRAGEHLLALINDILELSKVEAGQLELNPVNVDMHALFTDIQLMFKERAQSKHLQFAFEASEDFPRFLIVDDSKLRRVFVNLIGNAIKFTEAGGIHVQTRVDKINGDPGMLTVEIRDSGVGIPENEIGRLFKRFEQTSAGINKSSGTGLGLALSQELVFLMGGNITVSSEVGKGSVFTFRVEIKPGKTDPGATLNARRVKSIDAEHGTYRVLVVDDNEINLQVTVRLLKMVGFETNEAFNGADALIKHEQWDPNLVLMDIQMPVMDGLEATRRIKATERGRYLPVIALTANSFDEERKNMITLGFDGYIRKPFRESELFEAIGKSLGIKYIYNDENGRSSREKYSNNDVAILEDIAKLPENLVLQMLDAIDVADLDLLIELIIRIDQDHSELAKYLVTLANNYDYSYLQQILTKKGTPHEN